MGFAPRGLREVLEEKGPELDEAELPDPATYVSQLHQHLETLHQAVRENLLQAQKTQKVQCNQGTCERILQPGNQVLVSRQAMARPAGDPGQGPYVEKEALAVQWAVGSLHYYLIHNPFWL